MSLMTIEKAQLLFALEVKKHTYIWHDIKKSMPSKHIEIELPKDACAILYAKGLIKLDLTTRDLPKKALRRIEFHKDCFLIRAI